MSRSRSPHPDSHTTRTKKGAFTPPGAPTHADVHVKAGGKDELAWAVPAVGPAVSGTRAGFHGPIPCRQEPMQPESDERESASKISLHVGVDPTVFCRGQGGFLDPLERRRHLCALGFADWLGSN